MINDGLDLRPLRVANVKRCEDSFGMCRDWSPSDWSNAMAGEVGETCNLTKKMSRGEDIPIEEIAKEIADVVIYADLLAHRLGIDLSDAIRQKFNEVSQRVGSEVVLDTSN